MRKNIFLLFDHFQNDEYKSIKIIKNIVVIFYYASIFGLYLYFLNRHNYDTSLSYTDLLKCRNCQS